MRLGALALPQISGAFGLLAAQPLSALLSRRKDLSEWLAFLRSIKRVIAPMDRIPAVWR
jgi:hypothetical protein